MTDPTAENARYDRPADVAVVTARGDLDTATAPRRELTGALWALLVRTLTGDARRRPPAGRRSAVTLRWEAFLATVRERGEYETSQEAERAARVVLALLGAHLVGRVRAELAARLPEPLALILLNPLQAAEPLTPERFVRATAAWIEGATEQTALWDIGAVLSTAADAAGDDLMEQVLFQLPPGYDVLFGRPGFGTLDRRSGETRRDLRVPAHRQ